MREELSCEGLTQGLKCRDNRRSEGGGLLPILKRVKGRSVKAEYLRLFEHTQTCTHLTVIAKEISDQLAFIYILSPYLSNMSESA